MKQSFGVFVCALLAGVLTIPTARADYTSNPLVQWALRQTFEARLDMQFDFAGNDHNTAGFLAGLGHAPSECLTVGLYGSVRGSDRAWPNRMKKIRGLGAYAEYSFLPDNAVQPFVEGRLGVLDPTGPRYPTSLHLAGIFGVRIPLNEIVHVALSGAIHWAEDKIFNWRDSSRTGDQTDFTLDLGLRLRF